MRVLPILEGKYSEFSGMEKEIIDVQISMTEGLGFCI